MHPHLQPPARRTSCISSLSLRSQVYCDPNIVELYIFQLSLKDMLRCRSVCKTWNNLITGRSDDPKPIKTLPCNQPPSHPASTTTSTYPLLVQTGHATIPSRLMLLLIAVIPYPSIPTDRVPRIIEYEELKKHCEDAPLKSPEEDFSYGLSFLSIVGVCDDMVCLLGRRRELILWNQTTRLYRKLDHPPGLPRLSGLRMFGFGFSGHAHNRKVVLGFIGGKEPKIAIYEHNTLDRRSKKEWRFLLGEQYGLLDYCHGKGCFFGDSLHWLGPSDETVIIRFSFTDERFTLWPVYNKEEVRTGKHIRLMGTYDTCLCYYTRISDFGPITMWKMNDYGVTNSWTKVWTIELEDPFAEVHMKDIHAFQDGHILMVASGRRLLLYDLSKQCIVFELNDIQEAAIYRGF